MHSLLFSFLYFVLRIGVLRLTMASLGDFFQQQAEAASLAELASPVLQSLEALTTRGSIKVLSLSHTCCVRVNSHSSPLQAIVDGFVSRVKPIVEANASKRTKLLLQQHRAIGIKMLNPRFQEQLCFPSSSYFAFIRSF